MNDVTPWCDQFAEQISDQTGDISDVTINLIAPDSSHFRHIWEAIGRVDRGCFGVEPGRAMLHQMTFSGSNPEMPQVAELEAKFKVASSPWNQTIDLISKPAPYDSADFAMILDAIEAETRKIVGARLKA